MACENSDGGEDSDCLVVVVPSMEVRATREGVSYVLFTWEVGEGKVVASKMGNVAGYTLINVLRMSIVFKVFMVRVDRDGVSSSHQEVSPISKSMDEGK